MIQEPRPHSIVFFGSGPFASSPFRALVARGWVRTLVTQPDRETGRGRRTRRTLIAALADEVSVPVLQPHRLRDPETQTALEKGRPELFVVASYGRILPQAVLDIPAAGCLNVHPSLLPRHRGPSPVAGAILAGDRETGVTIMLMAAKMDAGPILTQESAPLHGDDSTEVLTSRLSEQGAELLLGTLPAWLAGELSPRPQDESAATYTQLLTKEQGRLDWAKPAELLEREIRAFVPWPVAYTPWAEGVLRIFRATLISDRGTPDDRPGSIVRLEPNGIVVATGSGLLSLLEVQPQGGRRMAAAEFVRGHPAIRSAMLG